MVKGGRRYPFFASVKYLIGKIKVVERNLLINIKEVEVKGNVCANPPDKIYVLYFL